MSSSSVDFSARSTLPLVQPEFVQRWSPRTFERKPIPTEHLAAIIEAARWSPSCFNDQPWRFYTSNDTTFADYLSLLMDANQKWAQNASVLGFLVSKQNFRHNDKPNAHADFDTGAAWLALSLQAQHLGYYTHGMAGVHFDRVYDYLKLDATNYRVIAAFAIGHLGDLNALTEEQRARETPNGRLSLDDIWVGR